MDLAGRVEYEQRRAAFPATASIDLAVAAFEDEAEECGGVRITLADRKAFRPVAAGVTIATALRRLYPNDFAVDKMQRLVRDPPTIEAIRSGTPIDWSADEAAFNSRREKYLLYR